MPRTADPDIHALRRAQLADATLRIVQRDGIHAVSVRSVAAEAGLSMGSLRHYFNTQSELLAFALGEVERRIRERLAALDGSRPPRDVLCQILGLLVPMSPQSLLEHEIWLAFVSKARTEPALRFLNERVYDEVRELIRHHVWEVLRAGSPDLAPDSEQVAIATDQTYALVDGLVLHAVLRPGEWPPDRLRAVLNRHTEAL